jgi:hypothetical protein
MVHRSQRTRRQGWTKGEAMIVTRPSRWGNPFAVKTFGREMAVRLFAVYAQQRLIVEPDWLVPLEGKTLCCWCGLQQVCHADVLWHFANQPYTRRDDGLS